MSSLSPSPSGHSSALVRRHLRFGWISLLLFVTAGILLETMHGLKVGWYLDETYEVRRLMWTLAHAHGTLLSLVHIAFAASVAITPMLWGTGNFLASRGLMAASVLLPGGFALGGIFIYDGDPGAGVFLAPIGAALMWLAVASIAWKAGGVQPVTPPTGDPASDTAKE